LGYGLLLAAGMTLVGPPPDARTGLLWSLAGFVASRQPRVRPAAGGARHVGG